MKYFYINIDNDETLGLQAVSIVDRPAIETNFLKFKDQHINFAKDEAKHILSGPALIAEMPIYRRNPLTGEEYYVIFSAETIEKLVERYSKNNMLNTVDLQHDGNMVDGVYMVESFIVNEKRGIKPKEFNELTDGSWIVSFKIEDEHLWKEIVNSGDFNGFSVEVMANLEEKLEKQQQNIDDLIDEILENK